MQLSWDWKSDVSHHVKGESDGEKAAMMLNRPNFRYEDVVRRVSEVIFWGGL